MIASQPCSSNRFCSTRPAWWHSVQFTRKISLMRRSSCVSAGSASSHSPPASWLVKSLMRGQHELLPRRLRGRDVHLGPRSFEADRLRPHLILARLERRFERREVEFAALVGEDGLRERLAVGTRRDRHAAEHLARRRSDGAAQHRRARRHVSRRGKHAQQADPDDTPRAPTSSSLPLLSPSIPRHCDAPSVDRNRDAPRGLGF